MGQCVEKIREDWKKVQTFLKIACFPWIAAVLTAQMNVDSDGAGRWSLANSALEVQLLSAPGRSLEVTGIASRLTGASWRPGHEGGVPFRFIFDGREIGPGTHLQLVAQHAVESPRGGRRQTFRLRDPAGQFQVEVVLEMFPGQPVLRQWTRIQNLTQTRKFVTQAAMLPFGFVSERPGYRLFRVSQWAILPKPSNFEPEELTLPARLGGVQVHSGARGQHCTWAAIRDTEGDGLFLGWEFDGRASARFWHDRNQMTLGMRVQVDDLHHPVDPGAWFDTPAAFLGLFRGGWDEAAHATQRFVDAALALRPPDDSKFPYVAWDSWGYGREINEQNLRRSAERAAAAGAELFIVDLGWAERIGDWHPDPVKFPGGLRALSNYVHSLGMKFGLHFVPTEAAPDSEVLRQHPDWVSSETYHYHGAVSICLAHRPVREWVEKEALRIIQEYNVDWILQDGQNMVKTCTRTDHTHHPADSNYANAVEGITALVASVRAAAPETVWENCADGGNMMTFQMVQNYVTSITDDASGPIASRQAVYGATYPFPTRYADRYMGDYTLDTYTTRSYMLGGPWMLMNRLDELPLNSLRFLAGEISLFKEVREISRAGFVYHLTARPQVGRIDAMQAHDPSTGRSFAIVTRDEAPEASFALTLLGLHASTLYRVSLTNAAREYFLTGAQLMSTGVPVQFRLHREAEIVRVEPATTN